VAVLIRRFLVTALTLFGLLAPGAASALEQRTATGEDDIKATFLFNFTKFVDWPARPPSSEPFRLCIVAEPAFVAIVDRTIEGESVGGRPLQRMVPPSPAAASSCQILFLGRLESDRAERWIAAVRNAPVLIVSESTAAWDRGAHINFFVDHNRVRFDVNADAATRAGISISSKLLRVARDVRGRGAA
jgi:hypothetical protein